MNGFYAYIRVSTTKQGEHGVSLQEQRSAIERYAAGKGLAINEWFEEQVSAAKGGRPVFSRMIRQLKLGRAAGVIVHKIDRWSRNLKDWNILCDLSDAGIQIHVSNEALDLSSRGGRLSADIQAVVASDYIRNLREETKKGFYGRLKQGLYPMPAPLGYLNQGGGKPKELDPVRAPLVRECFELYLSGRYTIANITQEMFERGLRTRRGKQVAPQSVSNMLKNPFYAGVIRIFKNGESYPGAHKPLVNGRAFQTVQDMLIGKTVRTKVTHDFKFRSTFTCKVCSRLLVGERQKGRVYYRCHGKGCRGYGAVREDHIEPVVLQQLRRLAFKKEENTCFPKMIQELREAKVGAFKRAQDAAEASLSMIKARESRLTDAYIDGVIDEQAYRERTTALRVERCDVENRLTRLRDDPESLPNWLERVLELSKDADSTYEQASPEERRELLKTLSSNRALDAKNPMFTLDPAFQRVADRSKSNSGGPSWNTVRTEEVCRDVLNSLSSLYETTPGALKTST